MTKKGIRRASSLPHREPELRPGLLGRVPRQASNSIDMLYFSAKCTLTLIWFPLDLRLAGNRAQARDRALDALAAIKKL
jgi:hypothetical protein